MVRPRQSHLQKTPEDRENYRSTRLAGGPSPTLETKRPDSDSTATPVPLGETEPTATYRSTRAEPSWLSTLLKQKGAEIIVGVVLLGILSFFFVQLFSLNRELGELKVRQEQHEKESQRREDRQQSEIDRLTDRLDKLSH
jgi:hypothetical protein